MEERSLQEHAFCALKKSMDSYTPICQQTWLALIQICSLRILKKTQILYPVGIKANSFSFVYQGLLRAFVLDEKGNEYNKMFFSESMYPAPISSLLRDEPSRLTIEALEDSVVIEINFKAYRQLLLAHHDLKLYQIYYLEKNWLLAKDAREIQLVQDDATQRYLRFVEQFPTLQNRLAQYHIASHLGITPTQLSRIRKALL